MSAALFRHAVELNAAAGRLLSTTELHHRRLLANRISDAIMTLTGTLHDWANQQDGGLLAQLRRAASLQAAATSIEEIERLLAIATESGYATEPQVTPVADRLRAIRQAIAAVEEPSPAVRRDAA